MDNLTISTLLATGPNPKMEEDLDAKVEVAPDDVKDTFQSCRDVVEQVIEQVAEKASELVEKASELLNKK